MSKKRKPVLNTAEKIKAKIAGSMELPPEIIYNLPLVTAIGTQELRIENFNGIIEFSDEKIRISTKSGILKIQGLRLNIIEINEQCICVRGVIKSYEFLEA